MEAHPDGVRRLIEAIVSKAAHDYRSAMRVLRRRPDSFGALRNKAECERFFLSDYFLMLTGLDGRSILDQIDKEFENGKQD